MTKAFIAAAAGALALAAPTFAGAPQAQSLSPEIVPGAGLSGVAGASHAIVRELSGNGVVAGTAFRLTPKAVRFGEFRSLKIRTVLFGQNAVKLRGTGIVAGRRVGFTAVGVHNALPEVDIFRIAWNHGASHGGLVTSGSVFIR